MGAAFAPIADVGGVVYRYRMFGFHDFTTDPRSGRPQPHISWLAERLITWTTWANSAICMVGAVAYFLKWREMDLPTEMALASGLFASIAVWRQNMFAHKLAVYRDAVAGYEAMFAKSAD